MEAVFEISLCFIVFPLLVAMTAKTGSGAKIGWAILTAIVALLACSIASVTAGPLGGILGAIGGGVLILIIVGNITGKDCPYCKSRIPSGATRCPKCQASLEAAAPSGSLPPLQCPRCKAPIESLNTTKCPSCGVVLKAI